jgi:hypothetical protein
LDEDEDANDQDIAMCNWEFDIEVAAFETKLNPGSHVHNVFHQYESKSQIEFLQKTKHQKDALENKSFNYTWWNGNSKPLQDDLCATEKLKNDL